MSSSVVALRLALHLIELTGPDRQTIVLSPSQVVTVREPRNLKGHFGKDVHCLIHTADGKFVAVVEDCATVRERLEMENQD